MFTLRINDDFIGSRLFEAVLCVYSLKTIMIELPSIWERSCQRWCLLSKGTVLIAAWLKKYFIPGNFYATHLLSWVLACSVNSYVVS